MPRLPLPWPTYRSLIIPSLWRPGPRRRIRIPAGRVEIVAPRLQHSLSRFARIVAADALQLPAKAGTIQRIQQCLHRGQIQMTTPDRQVIALADDRDEAQAEGPCRGAGRNAAIGQAGPHLPGCRQMPGSQSLVPRHTPGIDLEPIEMRVQQPPATRAWLPVHDGDVLAPEIYDSANPLGIP